MSGRTDLTGPKPTFVGKPRPFRPSGTWYSSRVRFRGLELVVDRHRVTVRAGDAIVATARWNGRTLDERTGAALDAAAWDELADRLARDEAEALAAAEAGAHDEAGVDLTLIDWMLSLTPSERLEFLRRHAAALAPFVKDDAAR